MNKRTPECRSCLGLAGTPRISPGPPIHVGQYWQVEHAYPSMLLGWLVIVLRRHAVALHELSSEEFAELGVLMERTVQRLHTRLGTAKEYIACYAEQGGFEHIHFHVVPRAHDMPEQYRGAGSFALLQVSAVEAVEPHVVRGFCETLQKEFEDLFARDKWALPGAVPEVPVIDLREAAAYYRDCLGFLVDWGEEGLGQVSRGSCRLFLSDSAFRASNPNAKPGTIVIWLNLASRQAIDALHDEWKSRGARIFYAPEVKPWNLYEFAAQDLDGNILRVFYDFAWELPDRGGRPS